MAAVNDQLEFFFYLGFTAHQDYFTHFEPSQSLRWGEKKILREKPSAILFASFGRITLWKSHFVQILGWLQQVFWGFFTVSQIFTDSASTIRMAAN